MTLARLKLQRGEGKLLVSSPKVRTRRGRATRAPSPPKVSLPTALEAPQVISLAEIEEVQVAPKAELESIAIISGFGETEGLSEEEACKKAFYGLTERVKILFEERSTRMVGENSKSPHGEGTLEEKNDEEKDSKGSGGNPPPYPPSSSSSSSSPLAPSSASTTQTTHTHSKTPKGKTPLLKLDIMF